MEFANNIITKEWMKNKYNELNKLYFDSYLNPMSDFVISNKKSFLGRFYTNLWRIELSTYRLRDEKAFINTMLHEMCHAYVRQKYGRIPKPHGVEWKKIANIITNKTNHKYGIIKRCGGANSQFYELTLELYPNEYAKNNIINTFKSLYNNVNIVDDFI